MNNVILLVLAICWLVPDHIPPWTSFHTEVPAFLAVVLALFTCWHSCTRVVRLPAAIGLLLILAISSIFQFGVGLLPYGSDALLACIYLMSFAAAWLWGYQWASHADVDKLLHAVCLFILAIGLLTAFQIFAQWLAVDRHFDDWVLRGLPDGRARANIGQPNQAATILLMACVAVAILRQRISIGSVALWSSAILLGAAIVLTRSRTSLVSAGLLTCIYVYSVYGRKGITLKAGVVVLWTAMLYAAMWGFPYIAKAAGITDGFTSPLTTVGARPVIWQQIFEGIMEHPWFGWGWLQVSAAQQAGALIYPGVEQASYAHNIILDSFVYLGIPFACLLLGVSVFWGWRRASRIRSSAVGTSAGFLLIPFLVHTQLEYPHAYAYFVFVGGMLFGLIDRVTESEQEFSMSLPKSIFGIIVGVFSMLLLVTGYEYTLIEEDFRINRFENRRLGATPIEYSQPNIILLTQLRDILRGMRLRAKPGMSVDDLNGLVRISKRYSWAQLQFRTALALGLNNRPIDALDQLRVIKAIFPPNIYTEARENWLHLGQEQYPVLLSIEPP